MKTFTRFLTLLAVLLMTAAGAGAQEVPVNIATVAKEAPAGLKAIMRERAAAKAMKAAKARRVANPTQSTTDANDLTGIYTWSYAIYNGGLNLNYESLDSYGEYAGIAVVKALGEKKLRITLPLFSYPVEAQLTEDSGYPYFEIANKTTVYHHATYGDCYLQCTWYFEGDDTYGAGWYFGNLGFFVVNGCIVLDQDIHFNLIISTGTYAGYRLGYIYAPGSYMVPNESYNGLMSYTDDGNSQDVAVTISEDDNYVVTVKNFGNYGDDAAVTMNLAGDSSLVAPAGQVLSQYNYSGTNYDVALYSVVDGNKSSDDLTGSGDDTKLTFDNPWIPYIDELNGGFGTRSDTEILLLDGTFAYPIDTYDLTVGDSEYGTVTFTVDGNVVTKASEGDIVTIGVTPDDSHFPKAVTARAYTTWDVARAPLRAPGLVDDLDVTANEDGTWSFTMPAYSVIVSVEYKHAQTVSLPAKSYATRYLGFAVSTTTADVQLYTISEVSGETATLQAIESANAEMPFLVCNDSDEAQDVLLVETDEETNQTVAPEFRGSLTEKSFTAAEAEDLDIYVLTADNLFVWVRDTATGSIAAGRCWIELPKSQAATLRSIGLVLGGETTGMSLTPGPSPKGEGSGYYHSLDGRRVVQPAKGVYVKDGRKVVVK